MDYVLLRTKIGKGFTICELTNQKIDHLAYVDDIAFTNNGVSEACKQIKKLSHEAAKVGLDINMDKTKYTTNITDNNELKNMWAMKK